MGAGHSALVAKAWNYTHVLLDQTQLTGGHHDAHRLGALDGLLLELGRALRLRHLLHFSSFRSRC